MKSGRLSSMSRRSCPRYADPWRFRKGVNWSEPAADLRGRPLSPKWIRRGMVTEPVLPNDVAFVATPRESEQRSIQQDLVRCRRRQSAAFSRYRREKLCTAKDLRTIQSMWFDGLGLRGVARLEGVSPAAVADRIARLKLKAPEFWRWCRLRSSYGVPSSSVNRDAVVSEDRIKERASKRPGRL